MKHFTLAALVTTCALADEGILGRLFPGLKENSTELPVRSDSLVVGGALRATHLKQASQIVNSDDFDRISKVREGLNKYLANLSEADVAKLRESRMIINVPARDTPTRDTHTLDTPTLDTPTRLERREVAPAPETPVISPAAEKMISSLKKFVADKGTAAHSDGAAQARSNVVASNSVVASKSVATNSEDRKAKMLESLKRFASGEKPSAAVRAEPVAAVRAEPVAAVRAESVAAVRAVSHENAGEHMMEALAKFAAKATPSSSSEVSSVDDKKSHMLEALKRYSGDSVVSGSTA